MVQLAGSYIVTLSSNPNVLFRELTDRAAVGIFVVQHGVFRYVNAHCATLFDADVDRLVDQLGLLDLVATEDRLVTQQSIDNCMTEAAPMIRFLARVLSKKIECSTSKSTPYALAIAAHRRSWESFKTLPHEHALTTRPNA